jgi:hypothetical protein
MAKQTGKRRQSYSDTTLPYRSFETILDRCLRVTGDDEVLFIYDESLAPFLRGLLDLVTARSLACTFLAFPQSYQLDLVRRIKPPDRTVFLPRSVISGINEASVVLSLLNGDMETGPFRSAILGCVRQKGSRLAHIPGFDAEILRIMAATPIDEVVKDCEAVAWALGGCSHAELRTYGHGGNQHVIQLELEGWDNEPMMSPGVFEPDTPSAASQLLPLVYNELRTLAAHRLAHQTPGQTLQPTALVHEAYLRLVGDPAGQDWDSRGHFFAAAAESARTCSPWTRP